MVMVRLLVDMDVTNLSKILTNEMTNLEKWMDENEFILNAKKVKTDMSKNITIAMSS